MLAKSLPARLVKTLRDECLEIYFIHKSVSSDLEDSILQRLVQPASIYNSRIV